MGLGSLKLLLVVKFLGNLLLDACLDLSDFLVSVLFCVLLDGDLLLFSHGSGPQFNFSKFLLLVFLELLSFLPEHILVELDNGVKFNSFLVGLKILDLVLSNLFESLNVKDVEDLKCSVFALNLELFKKDDSLHVLLVSHLLFLLLTKLSLSLSSLVLFLDFFLSLSLLSELFLGLCHLFLLILDLLGLDFELFFDLLEDSEPLLLVLTLGFANFLEHLLQLLTKIEEVLNYSGFWVESEESLFLAIQVIADSGFDGLFFVALVQESLEIWN